MRNLKRNLPPLTSLLAFEAAARCGSFKAAAEELNVSREAVSRQVRNLEEYLGVSLFERDANTSALGEIGKSFLASLSANLNAIARASAEIAGDMTTDPSAETDLGAVQLQGVDERSNILIVDDSPDNLNHVSALLNGHHNVATAQGGAEALRYLASNDCDLVLLDIRMPDMDGLQVCDRIKATGSLAHLPVIFVTSLDDPAEETRGLERGACDFISRPIVPAVLRARIQTHIELQRTQRSLESLLARRADKLQRAEETLKTISRQIDTFRAPRDPD